MSHTILTESSRLFADSRMATATNTTIILEPASTLSQTLQESGIKRYTMSFIRNAILECIHVLSCGFPHSLIHAQLLDVDPQDQAEEDGGHMDLD